MEVEFKENNWFNGVKDIFIRDEKKLLKIFYGANGDLYFDIFGSLNKNENNLYTATFSIKKSEMIYSYFEQLVNDIISCKVFEPCEVRDAERKNEYLKTKQANKKLVDNDTIIWYSDNIYDESEDKLSKQNMNSYFVRKHLDKQLAQYEGKGRILIKDKTF